jgi:alpha-L-rhamnosidase
MLNRDGTIYTAALRSCPATDFFILSGGEQVLEPHFTFHGFRYVEIRGLTSKPDLGTVTGVVVHSAMNRTGNFESSHLMLNQLFSNIIWGQKGNYLEVPTDCPQRDERMGWTGDAQFFIPTAAYNFDVAGFFTRWLETCEDNQSANGTFPHVVPDVMGGGGATAWGDAPLICTYNIYRVYGDTRIIAERFASLDRYMQWLATKTKNGISSVGGFGDWLNAGGSAKKEVIDTAYHAYLAQIMSEMAAAIGRQDDAARYAKLHEEVKAAFARDFQLPDGSLKESGQTGYALAFSMGLVPAEMCEKATEKFVEEIKRFNWHLATGFIGTPRLLPALNLAGRNDVAYRLLLNDTYPSWLFSVKNGATTMWERWNGWTPEGFGDISMNSYNHYAFGAVGEYLYGAVGGIQAETPGYKTCVVKPVIGDGLTWAKTSFDSIHGRIVSNWKCEGEKLTVEVTIPPNTTATIFVPAKDAANVTESGKPAAEAEGVKFLRMENGAAIYAVGSGTYQFQSALAKTAK